MGIKIRDNHLFVKTSPGGFWLEYLNPNEYKSTHFMLGGGGSSTCTASEVADKLFERQNHYLTPFSYQYGYYNKDEIIGFLRKLKWFDVEKSFIEKFEGVKEQFIPAYFETHFKSDIGNIEKYIYSGFAIITAYATTGETWSEKENTSVNKKLRTELLSLDCLLGSITGYSPASGHSEPGWAARLDFEHACDLAMKYKQDAIYYSKKGVLYVTLCDERRCLVPISAFMERITLTNDLDSLT